MLNAKDCTLYSGGANGAEAEFGANAERHGLDEVNYTFEEHQTARTRGIRMLTSAELKKGDVSLGYVSNLMHRSYPNTPLFRKVLQTIWYQVNSGQEIFVVGKILEDGTVKGGTGWGAEFAKLCNKPLIVFDQERDAWFRWDNGTWSEEALPVISEPNFTGTGTRFIEENGRRAIAGLFDRSYGSHE